MYPLSEEEEGEQGLVLVAEEERESEIHPTTEVPNTGGDYDGRAVVDDHKGKQAVYKKCLTEKLHSHTQKTSL